MSRALDAPTDEDHLSWIESFYDGNDGNDGNDGKNENMTTKHT